MPASSCACLCFCILPALRPTAGLNRCTLYSSSEGECWYAGSAAITSVAVVRTACFCVVRVQSVFDFYMSRHWHSLVKGLLAWFACGMPALPVFLHLASPAADSRTDLKPTSQWTFRVYPVPSGFLPFFAIQMQHLGPAINSVPHEPCLGFGSTQCYLASKSASQGRVHANSQRASAHVGSTMGVAQMNLSNKASIPP